MTRAAFLPTPIDPYICLLWMKFYPRWEQEIDKLYVYCNGSIEKPVADYIMNRFTSLPKVELLYADHMVQHGTALEEMTRKCSEELVMWIEDDGYIFTPGFVREMFHKIENNECDMIGSPRMSSSMDLQRRVAQKLGVDMSKHGDVGVGLWPNFFFCKRADLLRTSMDFNAHKWDRGEYFPEIEWTVAPEDNAPDIRADTFVYGAIQMRALGLRLFEIPQYHFTIHWENEEREHTNFFDPACRYTHSGSLSGSIYGVMLTDDGIPLSHRTTGKVLPQAPGWKMPPYVNTEDERREYERRCAFYILGYELHDNIEQLAEFRPLYIKAVDRMIEAYALDRGRIYNLKETLKRRFAL